MSSLEALYDAMDFGTLAISHKLAGDQRKATAAFIAARHAVSQLGPLSLTAQALRVALEDAEQAEVDA